VTSIDVRIDGGPGRQPAAPVTSTGVSFALRYLPAISGGAPGVSFRPRPLDRAEPIGSPPISKLFKKCAAIRCGSDRARGQTETPLSRQAEPIVSRRPLVTSIDVEISGRAGRQPVALVTSTGVSFSRWPPVTSIDVGIDGGRAGRQRVALPW
jgi:hypothetical protein